MMPRLNNRAWFQQRMDYVDERCLTMYNEEERLRWWARKHPLLDNRSPIRAFIDGDIEEVVKLAEAKRDRD
jgi:hypothetical protein